MTDSVIVSDDSRCPITAQRQKDGGVALRGPFRSLVLLSGSEIERLVEFARSDEPPRLGKISVIHAPTPPSSNATGSSEPPRRSGSRIAADGRITAP